MINSTKARITHPTGFTLHKMNKSWRASGGTYRFIGKFYFHASPPGLCGYFNPSIPWVSPMAIDMQALRAGV